MSRPLHLLTAGNVDDGKSTLIGRLLYDSKSLYEDHLQSLTLDSAKKGKEPLDFSLLTDGLIAEREQGITIDVAYRYFSTPKKDFILSDAPGHQQYIGNMAAAASQADVLVLLLSVERPLSLQTKRHSLIASLFGIKQVIIAVNKLDLFAYSQEPFLKAKKEYEEFASSLAFTSLRFIPISALRGDNIVEKSSTISWYQGDSLLRLLETTPLATAQNRGWRLPIQSILQSHSTPPFYAGTLEGGSMKRADAAICYPLGKIAAIETIIHREKEVEQAEAEEAVAIRLTPEILAERGWVLACPQHPMQILKQFQAQLVLFEQETLSLHRPYSLVHINQTVTAQIQKIEPSEIEGFYSISLDLEREIYADLYKENRHTGSFLLIDPKTLRTIGAGLIEELFTEKRQQAPCPPSTDRSTPKNQNCAPAAVEKKEGSVIWFTGLPGAGKTTLAAALKKALIERGKSVYLLDGDHLRQGLNSDLSFSVSDRNENVRRVAEVAALFADAGLMAIVALISPFSLGREKARSKVPKGRFFEVYVSTPLSCCEKRDPKKHYQAAREGRLTDFTGVSSPYEPPQNPELTLDTSLLSVEECVHRILKRLDV